MLKGKIDSSSGRKSIYGYLIDLDNRTASKKAILCIDDESFVIECNISKDFLEKKYGDASHAFKFIIPQKFKNSYLHTVKLFDYESSSCIDSKIIAFQDKKEVPHPEVSIIVPVYNTGHVLETTLMSIVNQQFDNIEIIVVNDCSPDNSEEIINKFLKVDGRIKYIRHEKNLSSSQARKNGVKIASGRFIMFVDGDDELYSDAVKTAYETIIKQNVDIVNFGTNVINCGQMNQARIDMNQRLLEPYLGKLEGNILKSCFIEKKFAFNVWNKIYKTELCKKAFSLINDGNFPKAQDLYAFFFISKLANSYYGIKDRLYKYNFGLGVTGGDSLDYPRFEKLVSESLVARALKQYSDSSSVELEKEIVDKISFNLMNECYAKFDSQLLPLDKNRGFNLLVKSFGACSLASFLSNKFWYQRPKIADQIKNYSFFQKIPRNNKITTIALYYNTLSNGGAQRVTVQIANMLSSAYKVIIISDEKTRTDKDEYPINKTIVHEYLPDMEVARVDKYKIRASKWEELVNKYKIDLVITGLWIAPTTFWDLVTLKLKNVSVVIHAHSLCAFPYKLEDQTSLDLIYRYMMCDGVVSLSKCDQFYISSFNNNCLNIANPPALSFYSATKEKRNKTGFNILWVGRISNEKRPLDAVRMMEKLVKSMPQCHLSIVGAGKENLEKSIKSLIVEKSLEPHISLEGFTLDVDKYYSSADIFICTSEYEGWSLTIGEAMSHHLPVVSYDMPYLSFFEDGRGIIPVQTGNYSLMATEIEKLFKDRERLNQLGEDSYKNISDKYNDDILSKWKQLISNIETGTVSGIESLSVDEINKIKKIVFFQITEFQSKIKSSLVDERNRLRKELLK